MNRVFRIVWSRELNTWVVASELASRHGKGRGCGGASVDERSSSHTLRRAGALSAGLFAALFAFYTPHAFAANRYWDVNLGANGNGGTGAWNTTTAYWNSSSDGVAGPFVAWNNSALDDAFFIGNAGLVTLGAPITAHNLSFGLDGYSLNGGTLTLGGATPTVSVAAGAATINSIVAGTAGLTKTGGGQLRLTGTNTFTGDIDVLAGTLSVDTDASLGNAANKLNATSGTGLIATNFLAGTREVTITGTGQVSVRGGFSTVRFTGAGGITALSGVTLSNAASDYTGPTIFGPGGTFGFTSIGNLGEASSLGAPTTTANGLITVGAGGGLGGSLIYSGDGDTSDRGWVFNNTSSGGNLLRNAGTGTLTLNGNIAANGGTPSMAFDANTADFNLGGTISSNSGRTIQYIGGAGHTITLGGGNSYGGGSTINGITVKASTLADFGTNSSFGTGASAMGTIGIVNGILSYTGGVASANRTFAIDGATSTIANDSASGGLALSGAASFTAGGIDALTLGGTYTGANSFSGVISGVGSVVMNGSGTWTLGGANTYAGTTTVQSGTLVASNADALGVSKGLIVNGGTLDMQGVDMFAPSLAGTGGTLNIDGGSLTLKSTSGSTTYAGSIVGAGSLTKLGASTQTLTGSNTYTGATTIGGGTLALDFTGAGAPTSNIIGSASALTMSGGTLTVTGKSAANSQGFGGLNVTAGNNRINATAGTGGTLALALGGINRTGGLIDFGYNTGATITTTHADGALGGWATVNGSDYAQVTGGVITAFADYSNKDDASQWLNDDIVSDAGGNANTGYFSTVNGNVTLGGLKYTALANSTVNVGAGNLLGVDGTIIVTSTVGGSRQTIQGGSLSGGAGGGALGVQQNSTGTFGVASTIVDNGTPTSFTVGGSGTGSVVLIGSNTYTGVTTVSGSTLNFNSVANGGAASAIGASSADAANLVLENGMLHYTGATASTDRGFTLVNGGPSRTIQVDVGTDLTFSGQVTSPDDAGFTKAGNGTLTFTNANNDFVGPLTVTGGELSIATLADGGQASSLGKATSDSANLILQGGGSLQYTGATTATDRGFTLGGGNGRVDVAQGGTDLTVSGIVTGAGGLFKDGDGTLVLSGLNNYTGGNTVTAGTLRAGSNQAFGGAANGAGAGQLTVAAGATADLDGHAIWVTGLNGAGNVTLGAATGVLELRGTGTFTGTISGAGSVFAGSGSVQTLSGCGNSYTGPTTIASSTLTVDCLANGGQNSSIGASSSAAANLSINSGWLAYSGADVSTDRNILLAGSSGISVLSGTTTLTVTGVVQGSGGLVKGGDGTLLLTGTNTYAGGTRVGQGVLRAASNQAFGTGNMTMENVTGAKLDLDGHDNVIRALIGGGAAGGDVLLGGATMTFSATGGSTADFAGKVSGMGAVVKGGTYRQLFSGCNSDYDGITTISAGTLAVNCLANGGVVSSLGASSADTGNLVLNGGTLEYAGTGSSTDRLFTLGPSATSALSATGTGAVQFTNTGAIDFSLENTAQKVTLTGTSTADNSLAAQITDNGTGQTSLGKTGTGTWILRNAASTFTGATTISGGVLGVDHLTNGGQASSIGASTGAAANLVIGNGATLRYTGAGDTTDRLFTLSAGSSVIESSGTGAIVFANTGAAASTGTGNRTLGLGGSNTGDNTMGGSITDGPGGITTVAKNGSGTWLLTGANTFTGNTVINGGTLQVGNGGTTGNIGSAIITVAVGTLAFDRSDAFDLDGTISGGGNVRQSGTGTTVLTAANTYTGGTSITGGTLQLGNGGTSGSIVGDVADNGTLAFDRSDTYTFAGLVSGTGGVSQTGTGTTVLTAANSYKGATSVASGTLIVDGDQTAATGATTVLAGATLGGKGTIGGNVTVTGGTLNPGDAGGAAGTLTIGGNLSLDAASALKYQFGQPDVVGGPLNDLTVVHGNLSLDGRLDFSATPGGSFGPGLYRIISYDGTLADNGLDIGTNPGGSYQVQTSAAHQVNLLNSNGLTLNFWDGPNGHGNNTVDGGNGVWQNDAGNSNWADQTGQYNAPYQNGEFGIFMGAAGTVTVDDTLGAVNSSGMQFAVDGYTVTGDAITLNGASNIIRVGDGTAAGTGMTATIDADLLGTGGLVKDDFGTLVLDGANTYTGGTSINDGTLQVANDANLGDAAGGLTFDGGTLRTTAAMATARAVAVNQGGATFETQDDLDLTNTISGNGGLTKTGTGALTLDGTNTYAGGTTIDAGSVLVSSDANLGSAGGALTINNGVLENTAAFSSGRAVTIGTGSRFLNDADLTLTGAVGGTGQLTKDGSGALILAADNTYTGNTLIDAGTLQIGNGG
ncbi:autotransporter-associated beta strand repeat-containing protein, partial [Luteibacter sp.]|uniref:autotransporter-associated beta strand repeat-containing protein n=1 Tax=Luteibacter sp. TaxID=1886636 RepID=UPI002F3F950A